MEIVWIQFESQSIVYILCLRLLSSVGYIQRFLSMASKCENDNVGSVVSPVGKLMSMLKQ